MKCASRLVVVLLAMISVASAHAQEESIAPRGWDLSQWELVPIQSAGRVKPMGAFAGEIVLHLSSRRQFEGWRPSEMLLSIVTNPKFWRDKLLIKVERKDVKKQLLLDESRQRFSVAELFSNPTLLQYAQRMGSEESTLAKPPNPNADPREEELKRIFDRLMVFHRIVVGDDLKIIPSEPGTSWERLNPNEEGRQKPIQQVLSDQTAAGKIRSKFVELMGAYLSGDEKAFQLASIALKGAVEQEASRLEPSFTQVVIPRISAEKLYHDLRPFHWSWILYVFSALFFSIAAWLSTSAVSSVKVRISHWVAFSSMFFALGLHSAGFGLRSFVAGRPPVSNMYESIVWVSFGAVAFSLIIYFFQRFRVLLIVGSVLGALGLLAADAAPTLMDPGLHPLVPVLRSNYWLTVHVLTITLGYAAFALTLGLGNVTLYRLALGSSEHSSEVSRLNQLTYRAMQFGVVLLAAGTILGGVWADYSWGRFWGWDPKEVWALIALLTYLTVLHGRYAGWVGPMGFAAWTVACFSSVVMAWYGVNFVLGVGLHSYGFSAGGQGPVGLAVLAQLIYVAGVVWWVRRRSKAISSSTVR